MTAQFLLVWALLGQVSGPNRYNESPIQRGPARGPVAGNPEASPPATREADLDAVLRSVDSDRNRYQTDGTDSEEIPVPRGRAALIEANPADELSAGSLHRDNSTVVPKTLDRAPFAEQTLPVRRTTVNAVETLSAAFAAPKENILAGQPTALAAALARRSDRDGRLAIAHAYWKLAAATAAHTLAVGEQLRLADLPKPQRAADPALDHDVALAARAAAQARVSETQIVAVTAQRELAEAMGNTGSEELPVAADAPYLGTYATRFVEIFTTRSAPVRLRTIHETLPTMLRAVGQRAEAATFAQSALDLSEQRYVEGKCDMNAYLAQFNNLSQQRQAFVAVARAYNDDIAEYAISVAREGTTAAELAGMMIRTRAAAAAESARRQAPVRSADNRNRAGAASAPSSIYGDAAGSRTFDAGETFDGGGAWTKRNRE